MFLHKLQFSACEMKEKPAILEKMYQNISQWQYLNNTYNKHSTANTERLLK